MCTEITLKKIFLIQNCNLIDEDCYIVINLSCLRRKLLKKTSLTKIAAISVITFVRCKTAKQAVISGQI
jgi:hypothetical protein